MHGKNCLYLFEHMDAVLEGFRAKNIFLFLDYDGTISPIAPRPGLSRIDPEMRSLIGRINSHMPVAVVSGRRLGDVKGLVGLEEVIYAGNHGSEIWRNGRTLVDQDSAGNRGLLSGLLAALEAGLGHMDGIEIEDKGITASVHYRVAGPERLAGFHGTFSGIMGRAGKGFRVTGGKKVFDIRPGGVWDKGDAVRWISDNVERGRTPFYIGDDVTDEDAYRAIKGRGVSVSVEKSDAADYFFKAQAEVMGFLEMALRAIEG